ncbi:MAG: LD-carboxypeptidase, partial [Betaproteobacteria bacterium]|nr:LD-carboxypeptidase [Betaproteobacteria bacterium]
PWTARASSAQPARRLLRPPRLARGNVVGLVAPSGVTNDSEIERATRTLETFGFTPKYGANIRAAWGGYAGSIAERVADLHAMFRDREVKAIFAIRGGSGASGLLPHLDYSLMRANPKILTGYSDITALHLAILRRAGLVTFHSPVATSRPNDYWHYHFLRILTEPQPTYTMHMSIENERRSEKEPQFGIRTYRHGVAEGRLTGGNLSIVASLAGTPYAAETGGRILFLEDVREAPYRIDRMLTQLNQAAPFARTAGVMFGVFTRAEARDDDRSLTLDEVISHHLAPLKVPAVAGYSVGHIAHQMTLPIGVRARLDTREQTLTLLEPAVI